MKQDYIAVADKSRIYPPGVAANGDGFDVCFISEAESCGLLLFKKGSRQPVARIPFPHEGRMGNVHFMTVKGEFEGLEYAFEEDGKEAADPFGRQFAGCGRWGPCVEINLRMNMGVVARLIYDNYVCDGVQGRYVIEYYAKPGD